MKKFSTLNEQILGGNSMHASLSNHYTPVDNIVTNVKNMFAMNYGIIVTVAEDEVSIKMTSPLFTSAEKISNIIYDTHIYACGTCIDSYVRSQGLDDCKIIKTGHSFVVYYSPSDIAQACPTAEIGESNLEEAEMIHPSALPLNEASEDGEEELEAENIKKVVEIISSSDKINAAKELMKILSNDIKFDDNKTYFAAVRDKNGDESIALRWKYNKKTHNGLDNEMTRSIMNIYNESDKGIWIADFDKNSIIKLPDSIKKLIYDVLIAIGATTTDDSATFGFGGNTKVTAPQEETTEEKPKEEEEDEKKPKKEKKTTTASEQSTNDEDEDVEDDPSREDDGSLEIPKNPSSYFESNT